jgi:hypothetical protein
MGARILSAGRFVCRPTPNGARRYTRPMPKRPVLPHSPGFVLGRAAFDRRNLAAEARRQAIRARHGAETATAPVRRRTDG